MFDDGSKQLNVVIHELGDMSLTELGNKTLGLLQGIEDVRRNHSAIQSSYQAILKQYKQGSTEGLRTTTLENLSRESRYLNRVKNGVEEVKEIRDDFKSVVNQGSDLDDVASDLSGLMQMLVDFAEDEINNRDELIDDLIERLHSRESDSLSDDDIQDIQALADGQPEKREVVEEVRTGLEQSVKEFAETTLTSSNDIDALNKVSQSPAAFMASVQTAVSEDDMATYQELYQTVLEHGFAGTNPDEAAFWALLAFYGLAGYLWVCIVGFVVDYAVTGDDPFVR